MIGISHISRCYGVAMATIVKPQLLLCFNVLLSSCLAWRFLGTIDISCIPCCHGNLDGIATKVKPQ